MIEGERKAHEYLARLQASQVDPDELALIVSMLYGAVARLLRRHHERPRGGAA
ncbi:MAG: hypothetical protein U1E72_03610 [Burkholderiaceae bacterium]